MIHDNPSARDEILSTLARHQDAENQCRPAGIAAAFAEQGVLEIDGKVLRGRRSILVAFERLRCRPPVAGTPSWPGGVIRQARQTHVEFISASEARCHTLFVATSATGVDHTGSYLDRFVYDASAGAWLIAHRTVAIDSASGTSAARTTLRAARRQAVLRAGKRPSIAGPPVSRRVG